MRSIIVILSLLASVSAYSHDPKNDVNGYCDEQSLNFQVPSNLLGVYQNGAGYKLVIYSSNDIELFVGGWGQGGIGPDFPAVLASEAAPAYAKNCAKRILIKNQDGTITIKFVSKDRQYSLLPWDKGTYGIKLVFLKDKSVKAKMISTFLAGEENAKPLVWTGTYCDEYPYNARCDRRGM